MAVLAVVQVDSLKHRCDDLGRSVGPTENVVTPRSREWTPPDSRHTTWAAALFSAVSVIHTWRRAASPTNLSPTVGSTTIATPWVVSFRAISVFTVLSLTLIPLAGDFASQKSPSAWNVSRSLPPILARLSRYPLRTDHSALFSYSPCRGCSGLVTGRGTP